MGRTAASVASSKRTAAGEADGAPGTRKSRRLAAGNPAVSAIDVSCIAPDGNCLLEVLRFAWDDAGNAFPGFKRIRKQVSAYASDLATKVYSSVAADVANVAEFWGVVKDYPEIQGLRRDGTSRRPALNEAMKKSQIKHGLEEVAEQVLNDAFYFCTSLLALICAGRVPGLAEVPASFRIAVFGVQDENLITIMFMRRKDDDGRATYCEDVLSDDDTLRNHVHAIGHVHGNHFDRLVGKNSNGADRLLLDLTTSNGELELAKSAYAAHLDSCL